MRWSVVWGVGVEGGGGSVGLPFVRLGTGLNQQVSHPALCAWLVVYCSSTAASMGPEIWERKSEESVGVKCSQHVSQQLSLFQVIWFQIQLPSKPGSCTHGVTWFLIFQ